MCTPTKKMPSALVAAFQSTKRNIFWAKFMGYLCMPCCCVGMACLLGATEPDAILKVLKHVIAFYGDKDNCKRLSQMVAKEQAIFRECIGKVNSTINPACIDTKIHLLQLICMMDAKFGAIHGNDKFSLSLSLFLVDDQKKRMQEQYYSELWAAYKAMGGNEHVIMYGIGEYICDMYDASSLIAQGYLVKLVGPTQLRQEVLLHRGDAGF